MIAPKLYSFSTFRRLFSTSTSPFQYRIIVLYFHHVYSGKKKRNIFTLQKQLNISGCYVFGKPGRIVAEGDTEDVGSFLLAIKRMKWQRVLLVSDVEYSGESKANDGRRFEGFFEVSDDKELREVMERRGLKEEFAKLFTEVN